MIRHRSLLSAALAALLVAVFTPALAAEPNASAPGDAYPLPTDPVTGEPLGDDPVILTHDGRELRFAGEASAATFRAAPDEYLPAVDRRIAERQRRYYPLTTCPVSGQKLGSMGDPVDLVQGNRLVRLCCGGCTATVREKPGEVIAKLDAAAAAAQRPGYPLDRCPVSGHPLGAMGEPVDRVLAGRLVRLCCAGCEGQLQTGPAAVLEKVDEAWDESDASPRPDADPPEVEGRS